MAGNPNNMEAAARALIPLRHVSRDVHRKAIATVQCESQLMTAKSESGRSLSALVNGADRTKLPKQLDVFLSLRDHVYMHMAHIGVSRQAEALEALARCTHLRSLEITLQFARNASPLLLQLAAIASANPGIRFELDLSHTTLSRADYALMMTLPLTKLNAQATNAMPGEAAILTGHASLKELNLRENTLDDRACAELDVRWNGLRDDSLDKVLTLPLTKLDASSNYLDSDAVNALDGHPTLESVDLSANRIDLTGALALARGLPALRRLVLRNNEIEHGEFQAVRNEAASSLQPIELEL